MTRLTKRDAATLIRTIFQILVQHPEGLSDKALFEQLRMSHGAQKGENSNTEGTTLPPFEDLTFRCVPPIKAGWLIVKRNRWSLSNEGIRAYETYTNPETFIYEAGKLSAKGWLATRFPRSYANAARTKDQITAESRTIRRVGIRRLVREAFGRSLPWQEVLPIQSPRRIVLPGFQVSAADSLSNYLQSMNIDYREGGHAIYLPPESLSHSLFKAFKSNYPHDAGLKIVKTRGRSNESGYVIGRAKGDSSIHLGMVHSHRHLSLVANVLFLKGIGPRLYDLVDLQCGSQFWTAYVIQHIDGRVPSVEECETGIQRLRDLDAEGLIKVILPEGFDDEEFECPTCCNNALVDSAGEFRYIDFQNFLLGDYEKFLTDLAATAAEKSHFGDKALLRGGRYLYQTVPGVSLPGKRSIANRIDKIADLLKAAGVSVEDRVVLDVGCNIGMMMAQYLRLGARWCHGWDRPFVTPHTERMLLALGCTRFSTTGTDITTSRTLVDDLPMHLRTSLEGCVISYLAVRGHLSWLDALKQIPWSLLIYEGHEGETSEDFETYLKELKNLTIFETGPTSTYIDGDSEERTVAILLKRP